MMMGYKICFELYQILYKTNVKAKPDSNDKLFISRTVCKAFPLSIIAFAFLDYRWCWYLVYGCSLVYHELFVAE